jgi:hypothetical protein
LALAGIRDGYPPTISKKEWNSMKEKKVRVDVEIMVGFEDGNDGRN